jgi:hypothetical protein
MSWTDFLPDMIAMGVAAAAVVALLVAHRRPGRR